MSVALEPLWKIDETLLALMESIETCPDEMRDELQSDIEIYLGKEAAKVDQTAYVLVALEYAEKAAADEIARLAERKRVAKAARERLEKYLCRIIANRGGKPLSGDISTLSVKPSDAVVFTDESAVPRDYVSERVSMPARFWENILNALAAPYPQLFDELSDASFDTSIDKAAIKKALKSGMDVPGADLEFRSNLQRK